MPIALKRLILLPAIALGLIGVPAAQAVAPGLEWFTLTTPHFRIHYHAGEETLAQRTARVAERIQPRLGRDLAWRPGSRTDLVLDDETDLANGFASPFPYNRMQVYAVPPDAVDGLEDYGDWLDLLITHEYTHVLHLDKAHGAPGVMRYIFGRNPLLFPNAFQPAFMTEGLATWEETDADAGVGRGQSTLYDMYMRMEVVSGVKPFDQVAMSGVTDWPAGSIPYLYGVRFYQFLDRRFGPRAYLRLVAEYSDNIVPFLLQSNYRAVLGWDTDTLWPAFERYLWTRYDPQIAAIRGRGLNAGHRLTTDGYRTGAPKVADDGRVFYIRSDDLHQPAIMVRDGGGTRFLAHVHPYARLDLDDRAGLLVAQPELCESRYAYYDLYRVDPDTGDVRRLTHCQRYHFAAWSPDGRRIAASRIRMEHSALVLLDAYGEALRTLWKGRPGVVLSELDWTPDGKALIAALFRPGSGWNLERFDLASGHWRKLTDDPVIETTPSVDRTGRYLYFSSGHGGVYNLRRMDLRTRETTTLTNVLGGAFAPEPAADGSLYYRGYTADGYDVFRLDAPSSAPVPASHAPPLPEPEPGQSAAGAGRYPVADYSPWRSLPPRWWMPTLYATEDLFQVGAYTSGADALDIHNYLLSIDYESEFDLVGGGLSYAYDRRYRFSYRRWHSFDFVHGHTDQLESIRRHDQAEAVASFPRVRLDYLLAAHVGAGWQWEHEVERPGGGTRQPDDRDAIVGAAVTWNDTVEPPRAISPSGGRDIRVVAETSDVLNSDFSGEVYSLDWQEYLGLWGKHVLALRVAGGWGTDRPRAFELGGANPVSEGPLADTFLFNRRDYPLRGYPTGLDSLTGRRMQLNSAEWHFPIATVERALTVPFVGLHRLHGDVFVDNGAAWNEGRDPKGYVTGAGTELFADVNAFYIINFRLGLGFARGFDEGGENQVYLTLSGGL